SVQIFAQGKEAAAENTCRIVKADDAALPEICLKKRMGSDPLCLSKLRCSRKKIGKSSFSG
ncbi:MAG: hypothetical protein IK080_04850, partial [Clostridia bacterium]|nr:hypothetical protein [Clostridia bacterium]